MTRRADATCDLLVGLLALKCGLVDQAQLLAAFEAWSRTDRLSMAEIFLMQGTLNQTELTRVDGLLAAQLADDRSCRGRALQAPPRELGLSATRAYSGPEHSAAIHDESARARIASEETRASSSAAERFRILRSHAQGGLGEVFLALDPELDRQVALKELRASHAFDPVSQSRFLREAKITGRLEHPGIVPVYALGRHADGRPYYAMRFIEGETLKQAIERFHAHETASRDPAERELAFRRLLRSVIDACNAVAYAHSRGVVHRDLKPENIMLGRFGETLVVDWGIAKSLADPDGEAVDESPHGAVADDSSLTRPGSAIGTPQYMSPEQAAGDLDRVEPASDVYSLGATLYCLLVGHGPFPTGDIADGSRAGAPRSISRRRDGCGGRSIRRSRRSA